MVRDSRWAMDDPQEEFDMPAFNRVREEFMRKLSRETKSEMLSTPVLSATLPANPQQRKLVTVTSRRSLSTSSSGELVRIGSTAEEQRNEEEEEEEVRKQRFSSATDAVATVTAAAEVGRMSEFVESLVALGYEPTEVISEVTHLNDQYSQCDEISNTVQTVNFIHDLVHRLSSATRSSDRLPLVTLPRWARTQNKSFPWPLIDMAEFEFGKKYVKLPMKHVVVLVNLPQGITGSSIPKLERIISELLANFLSVDHTVNIHFPLTSRTEKERQGELFFNCIDHQLFYIPFEKDSLIHMINFSFF